MILILEPNIRNSDERFTQLMDHLSGISNIQAQVHDVQGEQQHLTEIYLLGETKKLSAEDMKGLPGVQSVVRISQGLIITE